MKTYIHGVSDDLIEINGNIVGELNIYMKAPKGICFFCSDSTWGMIKYSDNSDWKIEIWKKGKYFDKLIKADDRNQELENIGRRIYSDALILKDGIDWIIMDTIKFNSTHD